jgi:hypothetical protein
MQHPEIVDTRRIRRRNRTSRVSLPVITGDNITAFMVEDEEEGTINPCSQRRLRLYRQLVACTCPSSFPKQAQPIGKLGGGPSNA